MYLMSLSLSSISPISSLKTAPFDAII